MATRKGKRVRPKEVTALLRELRRLVELGNAATYDEWLAYHERKTNLLERIAARPEELVDIDEATVAAEEEAAVEVDAPRAPRTSTMALGSAPPAPTDSGRG